MIKKALVNTLPIMAGYIFLGFAFGLLVRSGGYPFWYPIVMSICIYSGALEFAAVPLLATSINPVGTFIFGLMLSARHIFYGIPMLGKYKDMKSIKPFLIFGLTDEAFSIFSTGKQEDKRYYFLATLFCYLYWNLGTALGALIGTLVDIKVKGLDFTLTALFIVLFIEQIKSKAGIISGITGLIVSMLALATTGSSNMVIVSMIFILIALLLERKAVEHE